ncbi:MAG: hypothetical protein ACLTS6_11050 [Anaerobutyricum sp.]
MGVDPDPEKVENFIKTFPGVKAASSEKEILDDPEVKLRMWCSDYSTKDVL